MRLVKKIGLYFIGNLASKILSAILIPIYAFYVSSSDLGIFDYSQTLMQIIVPIVFFSIWEAILKYVISADSDSSRKEIINTALTISLISTLLLITVTYVLYIMHVISDCSYVFMMMLFNAFNIVLQYISRSIGENVTYVIAGIAAVVVNFIGVVILVVLLKQGAHGLFVSYTLGQATSCIIMFYRCKLFKGFAFSLKPQIVRMLLLFSLPMAANAISGWLIQGVGRVVINSNLGDSANGLYSYASKLGNLVTVVVGVVSMALMEELYIRMNDDDINEYFNKICNQIWIIILGIYAFVIPLIGLYYLFTAKTEYADTLQYVSPCILVACVSAFSTNVGGAFQIKDLTKYIFLTTLAGGIVTSLVAVIAVSWLGIWGVILAQFLGALTLLAIRCVVARRLMDFRLDIKRSCSMLLLICLDSFILLKITSFWGLFIFAIVNTMILIVIYRKQIKEIIMKRFSLM